MKSFCYAFVAMFFLGSLPLFAQYSEQPGGEADRKAAGEVIYERYERKPRLALPNGTESRGASPTSNSSLMETSAREADRAATDQVFKAIGLPTTNHLLARSRRSRARPPPLFRSRWFLAPQHRSRPLKVSLAKGCSVWLPTNGSNLEFA